MKKLIGSFLLACVALINLNANAEVVYYYNDLLGSPIAATKGTSTTPAWRENYRPYGERLQNDAASVDNEIWYTSRHQDSDTGLSYMGARYYNPVVGRFLSTDTIRFTENNFHSFNRYAYGNNNPYKFVDKDGNWPTIVITAHQNAIDRALAFLPDRDRRILKDRQVVMDNKQGNEFQYQHAMSVPTDATSSQALIKANDFVRNEIDVARGLYDSGFRNDALRRLGDAIHTMQDATSPSHQGGQLWDNDGGLGPKIGHVLGEFHDPGPGGGLDKATKRTWDLFRSRDPIPRWVLPLGESK